MPSYLPANRFQYSLFIAIAAHALAVIALGFNWAHKTPASTSIEVTLAQHKAATKVTNADFFAQIDQLGSGDANHKKLLSSPDIAMQNILDQTDTQDHDQQSSAQVMDNHQITALDIKPTSNFSVIVSNNSEYQTSYNKKSNTNETVADSSQKSSLSEQIVALKSQINLRRQQIAKAPKKRVISTMSTKSHRDAAYLENWRRKIVTVGNIHYPKEANAQKIYGRVRLMIAMQGDGYIRSIQILASSGKPILDRAAVKIIRLAAPFEPFSAQMRRNTDILEIIRTIEFEKTTLIY